MKIIKILGFIVFILGLIFKFVTDNPLTAIIPSVMAFIVVLLTIFYQKIITKKLPNKINR